MGKFRDIWDTGRDGKNAEKRSFLRYAIVATAIFILLVGFINQNNIVRWIKAVPRSAARTRLSRNTARRSRRWTTRSTA